MNHDVAFIGSQAKDPLFISIDTEAREALLEYIDNIKLDYKIPLPSEWASENRYLPQGTTEFPGYVDHTVAPHLVEIQDSMHPDSGIISVTVMKSTQSLVTTAFENTIGHSIDYRLHNILYIISSKNVAKMRSSAAIDVLIDYSGLAHCVKPISERMSRKVADNTFYKELAGNRRLMMTSYNSIGDAKSLTWDYIIFDELVEAPHELKGQGDPESIFEGRGKTARKLKLAKISTPIRENDRIHTNFKKGDQRYYNCPCPHCGEKQPLVMMGMEGDYGLNARSEAIEGIDTIIPDSVEYICKYCQKGIKEHKKGWMLNNGEWIPTVKPVNPAYRSYHVSNLMSPVMFYSWERAMQEYCETNFGQNITKYKNFQIDVLGIPPVRTGEKTVWQEVKNKGEDYEIGKIPDGGLIVTGGVDVQKNRLELQCVAWGRDLESWAAVDYQVFYGDTSIAVVSLQSRSLHFKCILAEAIQVSLSTETSNSS